MVATPLEEPGQNRGRRVRGEGPSFLRATGFTQTIRQYLGPIPKIVDRPEPVLPEKKNRVLFRNWIPVSPEAELDRGAGSGPVINETLPPDRP